MLLLAGDTGIVHAYDTVVEWFAMSVACEIVCPFCGQGFELMIDTSIASQQFTTDCEICCRPFQVVAECEPGEILSVGVESEG